MAILLALEVAIAVAIAAPIAVMNFRRRSSRSTEIASWLVALAYLGAVAAAAWSGAHAVGQSQGHGYELLGAVALAIPAGIVGAIVHQVLAVSFDSAGALSITDPGMSELFMTALVAWSVINPVLARRIRQAIRRNARAVPR